jgi:hypothetical protein
MNHSQKTDSPFQHVISYEGIKKILLQNMQKRINTKRYETDYEQ